MISGHKLRVRNGLLLAQSVSKKKKGITGKEEAGGRLPANGEIITETDEKEGSPASDEG